MKRIVTSVLAVATTVYCMAAPASKKTLRPEVEQQITACIQECKRTLSIETQQRLRIVLAYFKMSVANSMALKKQGKSLKQMQADPKIQELAQDLSERTVEFMASLYQDFGLKDEASFAALNENEQFNHLIQLFTRVQEEIQQQLVTVSEDEQGKVAIAVVEYALNQLPLVD